MNWEAFAILAQRILGTELEFISEPGLYIKAFSAHHKKSITLTVNLMPELYCDWELSPSEYSTIQEFYRVIDSGGFVGRYLGKLPVTDLQNENSHLIHRE